MPKSHKNEVRAFLTWMKNLSLGSRILAYWLVVCLVHCCIFLPPKYELFKSIRFQYILFLFFGCSSSYITKNRFLIFTMSKSWRGMRLCCSLFSCHHNKISCKTMKLQWLINWFPIFFKHMQENQPEGKRANKPLFLVGKISLIGFLKNRLKTSKCLSDVKFQIQMRKMCKPIRVLTDHPFMICKLSFFQFARVYTLWIRICYQ